MSVETDRELLELAATAAGVGLISWTNMYDACDEIGGRFITQPRGEPWNPLEDDGDALRLGAALRLHILHNDPGDSVLWVSAVLNKRNIHGVVEFQDEVQRAVATRRAIVRAAAAIGKAGK